MMVFRLQAQTNFNLKGIIFKKGATTRLSDVKILNANTKQQVKSDEYGVFAIDATIGDTIQFIMLNYQYTEKVIVLKQNLIIYLNPNLVLDEVVVKGQTQKAAQKEILDGYRSKGVYYQGQPSFLSFIFTPLTALYELVGKDPNNARRFGEYVQRENAQTEVDKKFNSLFIKNNIPIKEEQLVEFMYLYRPKPQQVIDWNDYDAIRYIKKSYTEYLKREKEIK